LSAASLLDARLSRLVFKRGSKSYGGLGTVAFAAGWLAPRPALKTTHGFRSVYHFIIFYVLKEIS
jgi:hypothetical protein